MTSLRIAKLFIKRALWGLLSFIFGIAVIMQVLPSTTTVVDFAPETPSEADVAAALRLMPARNPRAGVLEAAMLAAAEDDANNFKKRDNNNNELGGGEGGNKRPTTNDHDNAAELGLPPTRRQPHRNHRKFDSAEVDQQQLDLHLTKNNSQKVIKSSVAPPVTLIHQVPGGGEIADKAEMANFFGIFNRKPGVMLYPRAKKALIDQLDIHDDEATEAWRLFQNGIRKEHLYSSADPMIEQLLTDLRSQPIVAIEEPDAGTQLKLFMDMENGGRAVFKPMRASRELARTGDNQFYFSEFERHNAEIAAFHLDRVLGFNRVPPTVGRLFSITNDILPFAEDEDFNRTIFVSPAGNMCFHGTCRYYCDTGHAVCGKPDLVEGSFQAMIPLKEEVPRHTTKSPWRRSYSKHHKADWEDDPYYCEEVVPVFGRSRFLLDVIDTAIFDFMSGNQDRHHLDTFKVFGNESAPVLFDNGRSFGDPARDNLIILSPLIQCCLIRHTTLQKLLRFVNGPQKLSEAFIESSKKDLVYPLLTDDFYPAMDRRLMTILNQVRKCLLYEQFEDVVLDDGF